MSKLFSIEKYINKKVVRFLGIKITIGNKKNKIFAANKDFYIKNWNNLPESFIDEYKKLIKNLDDESYIVAGTILRRIKALKRKNFKRDFNTTKRENNLLSEIKENLEMQITCVGKAQNSYVWAYKDYLLYEGLFEPGIFYYDCYIKFLDNPNYFKNKDIIDAGAYVGDSSLVLAKYTTKNVYAFEPVNETYNAMKQVLELNDATNIIPVNCALGEKKETLPLTSKKTMGASFLDKTENDIPTSVMTLDDYIAENNLNVGLIKVDVEGFEQQLIKGAMNTIKTQKPTLLISIYHNVDDFFNIKPLIESWDLGYKFKIRKAVDEDVVRDTMLICEVQE